MPSSKSVLFPATLFIASSDAVSLGRCIAWSRRTLGTDPSINLKIVWALVAGGPRAGSNPVRGHSLKGPDPRAGGPGLELLLLPRKVPTELEHANQGWLVRPVGA